MWASSLIDVMENRPLETPDLFFGLIIQLWYKGIFSILFSDSKSETFVVFRLLFKKFLYNKNNQIKNVCQIIDSL